jgi:hypothetical protein
MPADLTVAVSSGEGEVVQAGDAEHGVVDAVAFETAVLRLLGDLMVTGG